MFGLRTYKTYNHNDAARRLSFLKLTPHFLINYSQTINSRGAYLISDLLRVKMVLQFNRHLLRLIRIFYAHSVDVSTHTDFWPVSFSKNPSPLTLVVELAYHNSSLVRVGFLRYFRISKYKISFLLSFSHLEPKKLDAIK